MTSSPNVSLSDQDLDKASCQAPAQKFNEIVRQKCAWCHHCMFEPTVSVKACNYLKKLDFEFSNPILSGTHPGQY